MNAMFPRPLCGVGFLSICLVAALCEIQAQVTSLALDRSSSTSKTTTEDGWIIERDEQAGINVHTRELTVHPRSAPRPALKYRFIPDEFDRIDGNAAIYYLKAMGFLEQNPARDRLSQIRKEAVERAQQEGKQYHEVPPEVWRSMPPAQLPVGEVSGYLNLTSFQTPFLREAAQRDRFDLDRNLRDVDDPIGYLLPDIQMMRELARTQSLRFRFAMGQGRIDDAREIVGQQLAMARHLGQDQFLVSNLVGMAVAGIAWKDAVYLVEHPEAPNLYWAFATLPKPLVDMRRSLATERQFAYLQWKVLREVDETPQPAGYWQDFLDRLLPQFGYFARDFDLPSVEDHPERARAALVVYIAAAYPGAKDYLINEHQLSEQQLEAYPTAQVVFLAIVRFYDQWRDEFFKWTYLPLWQAHSEEERREVDDRMRAASQRYGLCTLPATLLLPAVQAAGVAQARTDHIIALLQTVEAIRMYGAAHDGRLPQSLDDLPVPAPIEPFTGKPIDYEFLGDRAVLNGHPMPGIRYRLIVRFAQSSR